MEQDPFELLGIDPTATADEVHRARRRLAKRAHPDHGGDAARMQVINAAADAALIALSAALPVPDDPRPDDAVPDDAVPDDMGPGRRPRVATDSPSFTVEAIPVETFEALFIVANWMGDVLVDDPPYMLESQLGDPFDCWCRLDIAPDAGTSTVGITVATFDDRTLPDLDVVRDAWIDNLNRLDWDQLNESDPNRSPPS